MALGDPAQRSGGRLAGLVGAGVQLAGALIFAYGAPGVAGALAVLVWRTGDPSPPGLARLLLAAAGAGAIAVGGFLACLGWTRESGQRGANMLGRLLLGGGAIAAVAASLALLAGWQGLRASLAVMGASETSPKPEEVGAAIEAASLPLSAAGPLLVAYAFAWFGALLAGLGGGTERPASPITSFVPLLVLDLATIGFALAWVLIWQNGSSLGELLRSGAVPKPNDVAELLMHLLTLTAGSAAALLLLGIATGLAALLAPAESASRLKV